MTYYDLLEVSPNASAEVIRAAYKSLMQRYHPDRNPGDAAIAERAALVTRAYDVLSQEDKRAAYDLSLRQVAAGEREAFRERAHRSTVRGSSVARRQDEQPTSVVRAAILVAVIVVSGWVLVKLASGLLSPAEAPADVRRAPLAGDAKAADGAPSVSAPAGDTGRARKVSSDASTPEIRALPGYVRQLSVIVRSPGAVGQSSSYELVVPTVDIRVGVRDADNALHHLANTQPQVMRALEEKLAGARVEMLLRHPEGERYLAELILQGIAGATGVAVSSDPAADPDALDRYGIVEVSLPDSYSVK